MDDSLDSNNTDVGGDAIAPNAGGNSGINWTNLLGSGLTAGGNIFTQVLKNQAAGAQTAAAKKAAAASSSTTKLVIIAVIGLVGVGMLFVFLKKGK